MQDETSGSTMLLHEESGLWFPIEVTRADAEYQYMKKRVTDVDVAARLCKKRHIAVQAGGNVGMWPLRIARYFDVVHTFEAVPYYFEALKRNTMHEPKIIPHRGLISSKIDAVVPFAVKPDGRSRVVYTAEANAEYKTTTIDALELPGCDALFLDIEGHEIQALLGALTLINKFRPVITVEFWEVNEAEYTKFFASLDYKLAVKVHGDRIYVPSRR